MLSNACVEFEKSLLVDLERQIVNKVKLHIGEQCTDALSVVRRNRNLKDGDFLVYLILRSVACDPLASAPEVDSRQKKCVEDASNFEKSSALVISHESVARSDSSVCSEYISCVRTIDSRQYTVFLNRTAVFQAAMLNVLQSTNKYGCTTAELDSVRHVVIINCAALPDIARSCQQENTLSLNKLRSFFVSRHLCALLHTCGITAHLVQYPASDEPSQDESQILTRIGLSVEDYVSSHSCPSHVEYVDLVQRLKQDERYLVTCDSNNGHEPSLTLNLRQFLTDNYSSDPKTYYHGNLNEGRVSFESPIVEQLFSLERQSKHLQPDNNGTDIVWHCFHVIETDQTYRQQQIDIVWRMLMTNEPPVKQAHIVTGSVTCCNGDQCKNATEFYCLRHRQITEAYRSKYGEKIHGSNWEKEIDDLTKAVIRFELLSSVCHQQIKLDVSMKNDGKGNINRRSGIFVMYNCARLATLFRHFEDAVQKGQYPPLPSTDTIDWSKLQEQGEWELLFNFVLPFPDIVHDCIKAVYVENNSFGLHKICQFLVNLSNRLSVYYSKTHILCEPRPHLISIIHARLCLMKAVQQVMHNALALLDIQPFTRI